MAKITVPTQDIKRSVKCQTQQKEDIEIVVGIPDTWESDPVNYN